MRPRLEGHGGTSPSHLALERERADGVDEGGPKEVFLRAVERRRIGVPGERRKTTSTVVVTRERVIVGVAGPSACARSTIGEARGKFRWQLLREYKEKREACHPVPSASEF